jgi:hypothetical protein
MLHGSGEVELDRSRAIGCELPITLGSQPGAEWVLRVPPLRACSQRSVVVSRQRSGTTRLSSLEEVLDEDGNLAARHINLTLAGRSTALALTLQGW